MPRDRLRIRAGIAAVREVFWRDWDPLDLAGIAPADEYDSYAGKAYALAEAGAPAAAIAAYLLSVEREMMSIDETPQTRERAMMVAEVLVSLLAPRAPGAGGG